MEKLNFIQGIIAKDPRGGIRFINDFDITQMKCFYIIEKADTGLLRGWRAHRVKQRWFYVISGAFILKAIEIGHRETPSHQLPIEEMVLAAEGQRVLHVAIGYATAFKASEPNSQSLVFADYPIDNAPKTIMYGRLNTLKEARNPNL